MSSFGGVLNRLAYVCAAYRQTYGDWPTQARFEPQLLYHVAQRLDSNNFVAMAERLQLRSQLAPGLSVGGRGVVQYIGLDTSVVDVALYEEARRWLGYVVEDGQDP